MKINKDTEIGDTGYSLKDLIPYTLYDNTAGATSNISLNDDASKYTFVEIFYKNSNNEGYDSVRVPYNTKNIRLNNLEEGNNTIYFKYATVKFNASRLNFVVNKEVQISGGNITSGTGNFIYVVKVIGYK